MTAYRIEHEHTLPLVFNFIRVADILDILDILSTSCEQLCNPWTPSAPKEVPYQRLAQRPVRTLCSRSGSWILLALIVAAQCLRIRDAILWSHELVAKVFAHSLNLGHAGISPFRYGLSVHLFCSGRVSLLSLVDFFSLRHYFTRLSAW